jgi:hypothetical protein
VKIDLHQIAIRNLVKGYVNSGYEGVVGYDGALDIRPKFQREFVYDIVQQQAVIGTILSGFPLNVMYWSTHPVGRDGNPSYEMLDGQQRSMSICEYIDGSFSVNVGGNPKNFDNLSTTDQDRIFNYELMVYFCDGTEDEKLAWFEVINIAGLKLTAQELRNAVYTGQWLTSAKRYFSREGQGAHKLAKDYIMPGEVDRQALLEKAIIWVSGKGDDTIKSYMNDHRQDANADELWVYFKSVIDWAKLKFPKVRAPMRTVPWHEMYNVYGSATLDADALETRVKQLMEDDEVERKPGIYVYVLTGDERALALRAFSDNQRREAYERQNGICPMCKDHFEIGEMDGDHILPWSKGGKTTSDNCQMLCIKDNRSN